MKTKPILFNTNMVKAILDGRKTQTRRPLVLQDPFDDFEHLPPLGSGDKSPFAADYLWVRETWQKDIFGKVHFRADGHDLYDPVDNIVLPWKPSIHMPRCVSRTTLPVKSVKVERLQKIGGEVVYEGCGDSFRDEWDAIYGKNYPWEANPWVHVCVFGVIHKNIDDFLRGLKAA